MNTLDKITILLKEKGLDQKELTDYLGLGKGTFTAWKSGLSSSYIKHASKIAEFFDVSTDYLLNSNENDKIETAYFERINGKKELKELLDIALSLSDKKQKELLAMVKAWTSISNNDRES